MGQIDTLHADISIRGYSDAMGKIGGLRNAFQSLKPYAAGYLMSNLGEVKSLIGVSGLTAMIGVGTVKLAADLEQSRLLLRRFVDDDFGNLQKGIDKLSTQIPIPVSGLYDIASGAAQVGVAGTQNIIAFTEVVAKLATVSEMSFNETSKELAKLINVFGLNPSDVKPMANMIAGLSADSAADPGELITLMKYMSGPGASMLKMKPEDVGAFAASLKDAGASSEVAGTAMGRWMGDMLEKAEEFARLIGVSVKQFKEMRNADPFGTMRKGLKAIDEQKTAEDKLAAGKSVGLQSQREIGVAMMLLPVLEKMETHAKNAKKYADEQLELDKQFGIQAESTYSKLTKVGNAYMQVADKLGSGLAKVVGHWADSTTDIINRVVGDKPPAPKWREGQGPWPGADPGRAMLFAEMKRRREAEERLAPFEQEVKLAAEALGVKNDEITSRRKLVKAAEAEANKIAKSIKDPHDAAGQLLLRGAVQRWNKEEDGLKKAMGEVPALEQALAAAKARLEKAPRTEEEKKAAGERRFSIEEAGRKLAFDALMNNRDTDALRRELFTGKTSKQFAGANALDTLADKFEEAAKVARKPLENIGEDQILQFARQQLAAKGALIDAVARERATKMNARPIFEGAEASWKRIAAGAAEGDPMTRILRENAKLAKAHKEATDLTNSLLEKQLAKFEDGMIIMSGEP